MNQLSFTVAEARKITGLGHAKIYHEINSGFLKAKKCGRRTLILESDLKAWLEGLSDYSIKGSSK